MRETGPPINLSRMRPPAAFPYAEFKDMCANHIDLLWSRATRVVDRLVAERGGKLIDDGKGDFRWSRSAPQLNELYDTVPRVIERELKMLPRIADYFI
jgi:hypothetical protein